MGSLSLGRVVSTAIMSRLSSTMSTQICSPIPGRCTFRATSSPVLLNFPLYTCRRNILNCLQQHQFDLKMLPTTYALHLQHKFHGPCS